ncbi:MAG: hypothetical protein ACK5CW_11685 [Verrucomicrobiota bacterium]
MKTLCIWLAVAIPLAGGVTKSGQKSLTLFAEPSAVSAPAK